MILRPLQRARRAKTLFWAATLLTFVMAVLPHPPELPGNPSDKIQHIAAFAVLGLLSAWAYRRTGMLKLIAGLSLFGALIELVQLVPALHRDSDIRDWLADTIACAAVLGAIYWRHAGSGAGANRVASDRR